MSRTYSIWYDNVQDRFMITNSDNETVVTFDADEAETWARRNIDMTCEEITVDGDVQQYQGNLRSMVQNGDFEVSEGHTMYKQCQRDIKALMFAML